MHTLIAEEGTHFTYNGDFSGEVFVKVGDSEGTRQIKVPAHDLLRFAARYVLGQRIERLEDKTWQELLT